MSEGETGNVCSGGSWQEVVRTNRETETAVRGEPTAIYNQLTANDKLIRLVYETIVHGFSGGLLIKEDNIPKFVSLFMTFLFILNREKLLNIQSETHGTEGQ